MRGVIAHGMHRMIYRSMHLMLLIFFHRASQVVLKLGAGRLALKYRISKSQDLIDQNEREIAT
jgi:hypothetical protein